jgi:hypothetical protein
MNIKMLLFNLLLQTTMLVPAQTNSRDGIISQNNKPSSSIGLTESQASILTGQPGNLKRTGQKSRLPLPVYLKTLDNKSTFGSIHAINDSAIIFSAKRNVNNVESNKIEIKYSNIREIKVRKKNGILKGFFYGTGVGLLPLIGGAIIGKGEGGAYVSVITLPLGVITGTLIGSSRKKFNINGNTSSFYDFKKRME